jgi:inner membrane protein
MDIDHWFTPLTWLSIALVLAGLEIILPGAFMIWIALAAGIMALLVWGFDPAWPWQIVFFSALSIASVLLGRRYFKINPIRTSNPELNQRAHAMLGEVVVLVEPIVNGHGKAVYGDAPWLAQGPDLPKGAQVRIVDVVGATLHVEAVEQR